MAGHAHYLAEALSLTEGLNVGGVLESTGGSLVGDDVFAADEVKRGVGLFFLDLR